MKRISFFLSCAAILFLASCGGRTYERNPVDDYVKALYQEPTYSIILHDMDVEGTFSKVYKHQYRIITEIDSMPQEEITAWQEVPESFFWENEDNMGMEIASKTEDGTVSRTAAPPGYSNYVGNPRYGYWHTSGGSSFWTFYGQYMFMSQMFGMTMNRPVYRREYDDYRSGYRGSRAYYGGSTGKPKYGTNSDYTRKRNPDFFERRSNKSGFNRSKYRSSRSSSRGSSGSGSSRRGGSYGK